MNYQQSQYSIIDEMEELELLESFRDNFYSVSTMQPTIERMNEEMITSSLIAGILYNLLTQTTDLTYIKNCETILHKKQHLKKYSTQALKFTEDYYSLMNQSQSLHSSEDSDSDDVSENNDMTEEEEFNERKQLFGCSTKLLEIIFQFMKTITTNQSAILVFKDLLWDIQSSSYYTKNILAPYAFVASTITSFNL